MRINVVPFVFSGLTFFLAGGAAHAGAGSRTVDSMPITSMSSREKRAASLLATLILNHPKGWVRRVCRVISGADPRSCVRLLTDAHSSQPLFRVLAGSQNGELRLVWLVNVSKLLDPGMDRQRANRAMEKIAGQVVKFFCPD